MQSRLKGSPKLKVKSALSAPMAPARNQLTSSRTIHANENHENPTFMTASLLVMALVEQSTVSHGMLRSDRPRKGRNLKETN
eukprot:535845-Pleurochrysis_carterae.AAC.1